MTQTSRALQFALRAMYAGAALSALSIPLTFAARGSIAEGIRATATTATQRGAVDDITTGTVGLMVTVAAVSVVLWLVLARLNRRGRWWARIVSTVLAGFAVLQTWSLVTRGHLPWYGIVVQLLIALTGVVAAGWLWHRSNAAHFERVAALPQR
ncbi:hypothetical protein G9U51_11980 [Calidifontibacter sp. DB0510]|uniref:Uncharacterized protein n=1 Tax=Metallococcus carri TaxID=1656884 RepID=A0A967B1X2_9MICO|nr:hypothetical protein [Metallococcus carri]NHN56497.1 hypothetical protein [Metallococcus carri]NOP36121.1 hypothetical protein [Calidifontibacter sp. DB2511S]